MNNIVKLIICIVVCEGVGIIAGIATSKSIGEWYLYLNKPSFNPPNWIFGPVWTLLYLMMGISVYLIWKEGINFDGVNTAIVVFAVHLIINGLWSFVFFLWKSTGWGLVVILTLWLLIVICIILFYKINSTSAILLIPYLLWVSFASVLNWSLWKLN